MSIQQIELYMLIHQHKYPVSVYKYTSEYTEDA